MKIAESSEIMTVNKASAKLLLSQLEYKAVGVLDKKCIRREYGEKVI